MMGKSLYIYIVSSTWLKRIQISYCYPTTLHVYRLCNPPPTISPSTHRLYHLSESLRRIPDTTMSNAPNKMY